MDTDRGALVHARAVVAHVALDLDLDVGVDPSRNGVSTIGMEDAPAVRGRSVQ